MLGIGGNKKRLDEANQKGIIAAINRSQAVIEFTLDGKILHANENFLNALGYSLEEIVGQHHAMFVDPAYAHPGLSFVILGVIVQICSLLYLSLLIFAGARLAAQFRLHRRAAAGATAGVGGVFIGFGAKLATATLG